MTSKFSSSATNKIVSGIKRLAGMPTNLIGGGRGALFGSSTSAQWVTAYNDSGEEMPAYAMANMEEGFDENDEEADETLAPKIKKPDVTFRELYGFSVGLDIPDQRKTGVKFEVGLVLYDDANTPEYGEMWGAKPGQWEATKGAPGFMCLGIWDEERTLMLAEWRPITQMLGKTTTTIAANDVVDEGYEIYGGSLGSEVNLGYTTLPDAVCRYTISSGVWIRLSRLQGGWEMEPLEC